MNKFKIVIILIITLGLAGCANMSQIEQRTVTGGASGAAFGAIVGALTGNAAMGAAIGGAAGATGGYIFGKHKEAE